MIHAICDFCGLDVDRTAFFLTIKPFQNFARYHDDTTPYGYEDMPKSFVICHDCMVKHGLPNPYFFRPEKYKPEKMKYQFFLDSDKGEGLKCKATENELETEKIK